MAKDWNGQTYNENWEPLGAYGEVVGPKDVKANAEWAEQTGGQNPHINYGAQTPAPAPAAAPAAPAGGGLGAEVDTQLMSQIKPPTGVNTADPAFQQQLNAGQLANHRAAERSRMAAAQRLHAQGQSGSGALDAAMGGIVQQQGEADQAFEAQLMDRFLNADRDRAARALQLATGLTGQREGFGVQREGFGLQRELGLADIALRREGMNQQNNQFYDSLGQQLGLSQAQLNNQAMMALLGM